MIKPQPLLVVVALMGTLAACAKEATPATAEAEPAADSRTAAESKPVAPYAGERAPVDDALTAYEEIRVALVNDKLDGVEAASKKVAEAASKASEKATPAAKPHLDGLAAAASALSSTTAQGIEPVRKAFGEVSKHLVGLLVAEPALAQGKLLFECPMAAGYKKWVQHDATIANPYMGQRMLRCGGKVDWAV